MTPESLCKDLLFNGYYVNIKIEIDVNDFFKPLLYSNKKHKINIIWNNKDTNEDVDKYFIKSISIAAARTKECITILDCIYTLLQSRKSKHILSSSFTLSTIKLREFPNQISEIDCFLQRRF
jgi:hypothetical protein